MIDVTCGTDDDGLDLQGRGGRLLGAGADANPMWAPVLLLTGGSLAGRAGTPHADCTRPRPKNNSRTHRSTLVTGHQEGLTRLQTGHLFTLQLPNHASVNVAFPMVGTTQRPQKPHQFG